MNRFVLPVAAVALAASTAVASPEGLQLFVNVSLDSTDSNWNIIDSLHPFDAAMHNLGGAATLLTAQVDFVTDVLVTSSVSTVGNLRTITINFDSVTGGLIFQPGHEALFQAGDLYWVSFVAYTIDDPDRAGLVEYTQRLRDVQGNDWVGTGLTWDGFFGGFGFIDSHSLASSDFFGISVGGFSVEMTYAIPAPASLGLLALAGLTSRRRL
ncbi:MAG: hypothetical protein KJZ65_09250 [Phycisphaerales bacterium]|nr:hypothetical protein [Phycisphaerales bacterium]